MKRLFTLLLMACFLVSPMITLAQKHKRKAKKAYNKGHYLHAASNYVEALFEEKKPEKKHKWKCEMLDALIQAEPTTLARIAKLEMLTEEFLGDHTVYYARSIVNSYDSLAKLDKRFQALPPAYLETKKCNRLSFSTGDYLKARQAAKKQLDTLSHQAAAFHYQNALSLMAEDKMYHYRTAYAELQLAMKFVSSYKDAKNLLRQAHLQGQRRVMVLPFAYRGAGAYRTQSEILRNAIIGNVEKDQNAAFWVTFVEYKQGSGSTLSEVNIHAIAQQLDLDHVYMGQITSVTFPKDDLETKDGNETHKVIKGTQKVAIPDKPGKFKTENIYGEETFSYRSYTQTVYGKVKGSYRVYRTSLRSWSNTQELSAAYSDSYFWVIKTGGSEKAWKKTGLNKTKPRPTPHAQRVPPMIDKIAVEVANVIIHQERRNPIPVKTIKNSEQKGH